jgi:hypothetical protein
MSHSVFRLSLAAAAGAALVVVGLPTASAAPETDDRGYVDSTASCPSPSVVVEFGSTDSSRVAICTNDGEYQYRGVRVRDGAKVILDAEKTDSGAFVAENDGIEYEVAAKSLIISSGSTVIREEPWIDFHTPGSTSGSGSGTSTGTSQTPTRTTPLPPPLPAERGGGS